MGRALSHVGRVLAIAVALTGQAVAGTLYVTPAGSDANPGTLAAPFATPGKALALAAAGDTILLRAGTYTITRTLSTSRPPAETRWRAPESGR